MKTLHVYNPSHDEALAAGSPYYTPSLAARCMEDDLCAFPSFWADEGDEVLLAGSAPQWESIDAVEVWGWDARLVRRLRLLGAPSRLLPTDEALASIRRLSSRATAVRLLPFLRQDVENSVGESRICRTMDEVEAALSSYGALVLKALWSCSGRGVFCAALPLTSATEGRIRRLLQRQGGIEAEPFYEGGKDFAMEFFYDGKSLRYEGLSVFRTSKSGDYAGNYVDSEENLLARLLPAEACRLEAVLTTLSQVRSSISHSLPALLGSAYVGPLGVDMLLLGDRIHPCIEINLRQTMGRVALMIYRKTALPSVLNIRRVMISNRTNDHRFMAELLPSSQ